jgi:hypothetical protein
VVSCTITLSHKVRTIHYQENLEEGCKGGEQEEKNIRSRDKKKIH